MITITIPFLIKQVDVKRSGFGGVTIRAFIQHCGYLLSFCTISISYWGQSVKLKQCKYSGPAAKLNTTLKKKGRACALPSRA